MFKNDNKWELKILQILSEEERKVGEVGGLFNSISTKRCRKSDWFSTIIVHLCLVRVIFLLKNPKNAGFFLVSAKTQVRWSLFFQSMTLYDGLISFTAKTCPGWYFDFISLPLCIVIYQTTWMCCFSIAELQRVPRVVKNYVLFSIVKFRACLVTKYLHLSIFLQKYSDISLLEHWRAKLVTCEVFLFFGKIFFLLN